jgi:hypothetical protein
LPPMDTRRGADTPRRLSVYNVPAVPNVARKGGFVRPRGNPPTPRPANGGGRVRIAGGGYAGKLGGRCVGEVTTTLEQIHNRYSTDTKGKAPGDEPGAFGWGGGLLLHDRRVFAGFD